MDIPIRNQCYSYSHYSSILEYTFVNTIKLESKWQQKYLHFYPNGGLWRLSEFLTPLLRKSRLFYPIDIITIDFYHIIVKWKRIGVIGMVPRMYSYQMQLISFDQAFTIHHHLIDSGWLILIVRYSVYYSPEKSKARGPKLVMLRKYWINTFLKYIVVILFR